jgi:NDP-sugar pyrophosphorylase family protein
MTFFPLWSAVMNDPKEDEAKVHTNATVESHFRNLKQSTLQKRTRLRPGEVIRRQLVYVNSKINEATLNEDCTTQTSRTKRRRPRISTNAKDLSDLEEKWSKRKPSANYRNVDTVKRVLFKKGCSGRRSVSEINKTLVA